MSDRKKIPRPKPPGSLENTVQLPIERLQPGAGGAQRKLTESSATVVFADIADSTELFNALGDLRAHRVVDLCLRDIVKSVAEHHGRVVKKMGDGVLSVFDNANAAVGAAIEMQGTVSENPPDGCPVAIHVGIHAGPVLCEAADVFGDTVNIGAYMCALALGGQILLTEAVVGRLSPAVSCKVRPAFYSVLKGGRVETMVHQALWQDDLMERTEPKPQRVATGSADAGAMLILWRGKRLALDYHRRSVTLGRLESCDVVIPDKAVSRRHAVIAANRSQFYLSDESINGTHVRLSTGAEVHLLRSDLLLDTHGTLLLGRGFTDDTIADVITYRRDRRSMFRP